MKKRDKKHKDSSGRKLALTIILGVFIAIMVISLFNLLVDYVYPSPQYKDICTRTNLDQPYPTKLGDASGCCNFSKVLQDEQEVCYSQGGQPIFEYDNYGCAIALKECDMCSKEYENANKTYNRQTFFVFALIGFALIVFGLFSGALLLQLISLPAGAFLVIEAAIKNFDDKLYVIITFSLLIIAAVYLALRRLGNLK